MTLLGAVIGDGHVLVGADGRAMEQGEAQTGYSAADTFEVEKIHPVSNTSLVWGLAGVVDPAVAFAEWLGDLRAATWEDLKVLATAEVAKINHEIRAPVRAAMGLAPGMSSGPFVVQGVSVLIAGYVGGRAGVLTVSDLGQPESFHDSRPHFLGPYASTARVSWVTVQRFVSGLDLAEPSVFRRLFEGVSDTVAGLYLPVSLWRVSPNVSPEKIH